MGISKIDHVAVTTGDLDAFIAFYQRVFGARIEGEHEIDGKRSIVRLRMGGVMLNVHRTGHGHPLVARTPTPGAVDICFRWDRPIAEAITLLKAGSVEIIEGPGERICSDDTIGLSVYCRDPDGNLVELLSTVSG